MILSDDTALMIMAPIIIIFMLGNAMLLWSIVEDKAAEMRGIAIILMILTAASGVIVDKTTTTVSQAVDNIHQDAEIIEGVIESISFDPNKGLALTVDGDILHITPHGDAKVPLKDNNRKTYASVKPEIGDTIGYKEYTFRDEDYSYAVSYTEKNQNE